MVRAAVVVAAVADYRRATAVAVAETALAAVGKAEAETAAVGSAVEEMMVVRKATEAAAPVAAEAERRGCQHWSSVPMQ